MVSLILFGVFFLLLFLNIPIGLSLGISSVAALLYEKLPLSLIHSTALSAVPLEFCWQFRFLFSAVMSWKRAASPAA